MSLKLLETNFNKLVSKVADDYPLHFFIADMKKLFKEANDEKSPKIPFGKKYKGKTVAHVFEIDPGYISFILASEWIKKFEDVYAEIERLKPYYKMPVYRENKKPSMPKPASISDEDSD